MPSSSSPLLLLEQAVAATDDTQEAKIAEALGMARELIRTSLSSGASGAAENVGQIVRAIAKIEGDAQAEVRIESLIDAAHFYYVIGQPFSSIDPAREAATIARRTGQRALLRKALNVYGVMCGDTGNISEAIEALSEALDLARDLADFDSECKVWVNIGVVMFNCAQYRDAISCFETAITIAEVRPALAAHRITALSNIALCSSSRVYARGLKAAEIAVSESPEPATASEMLSRVLRENNYIRLLLEVNSIDRARERCAIARKYANASHSARAEIAASIAEGLCEVQSGSADVGISRLTSTLEGTSALFDAARHLNPLVKHHELVGQPQRALVTSCEMMEAMRQVQQENALRHLKLHLDHLGISGDTVGVSPASLERREAALRGLVAEQELFKSRIEMLERLAVTAELRDDSTGEHSYRVGKLAALLAAEYGCDDGTCFMIELAARLHDIGKIGVPDAILLKPEKLNDAEREVYAHSHDGGC